MSDSGYEVRPYREGDEDAILELFNSVFAEGDENFQPRRPEEWRWEYLDNPAGQQIMLAVQPSGRVIAHYACLPARLQCSGEEHLVGQGVDSMVHQEFRRGLKREGPFLATARGYFETFGHAGVCFLGFGYPNQRAYRIGVRVLKYEPVFQPIPALYRNFFQDPDDDAVGRAHTGSAEVQEVPRFGDDVSALWQEVRGDLPLALIRDRTYLNWRYADCPRVPYRLFEIRREGRLRGWFVLRPGWQNLPILALVDFLAPEGDVNCLALALRAAVRVGREQEQARIEAWFGPNSWPFREALELGFHAENSQYVLCVMRYHDRPTLDWVRQHWYYTIGDSDVF